MNDPPRDILLLALVAMAILSAALAENLNAQTLRDNYSDFTCGVVQLASDGVEAQSTRTDDAPDTDLSPMWMILPAGLMALTFTCPRRSGRARGGERRMRDDPKSLAARHVRARFIAIIAVILAFIAVMVLLDLFVPTGPASEAYSQGRNESTAAISLSLWIGTAAYGISRLYHRLRFGPASVKT